MKASIVDLRYNMKDVLKALDRNESVTVFYHGKPRGVLVPATYEKTGNIVDHAFFGMFADKKESVSDEINSLRQVRYHDV